MMTTTEAREYAVKLTESWPDRSGVQLDVWVSEFRPLDAGTVGTAIVRLRRDLDRPPTVHRFLTEYRNVDTASRHTAHECSGCDGTGWVEAPDRVVAAGEEHERRYSQVTACRVCKTMEQVQATINRVNHRPVREQAHEDPQPLQLPGVQP